MKITSLNKRLFCFKMKITNYIKTILFLLLTILLGTQTTYAKTKLISPQNQIFFSIEQSQNFKSLDKEVQLNIGFFPWCRLK